MAALSVEYEKRFWDATVECLELLGVEPWNLRQELVRTFLERLEATGNAQARELVFHSEPGHVACDLADPRPTPERVAELWPQFQEIAERHLGGEARPSAVT